MQDNHSASADVGTLRGMHYQAPPRAQEKLMRCTRGALIDVAVDARKGSPTYGESVREKLSAEKRQAIARAQGLLERFCHIASRY